MRCAIAIVLVCVGCADLSPHGRPDDAPIPGSGDVGYVGVNTIVYEIDDALARGDDGTPIVDAGESPTACIPDPRARGTFDSCNGNDDDRDCVTDEDCIAGAPDSGGDDADESTDAGRNESPAVDAGENDPSAVDAGPIAPCPDDFDLVATRHEPVCAHLAADGTALGWLDAVAACGALDAVVCGGVAVVDSCRPGDRWDRTWTAGRCDAGGNPERTRSTYACPLDDTWRCSDVSASAFRTLCCTPTR